MYENRDYFQASHDAQPHNTWSLSRTILWSVLGTFVVEVFLYVVSPDSVYRMWEIFGLVPAKLVERFWLWQAFSYMFLHDVQGSFPFHLVFNLLVLWYFGNELELRYGRQKFGILVLVSGVFAGLLQAVIQYFTMPTVPVIGLSGAMMAVLACAALLWPDREMIFFFFPLKLKYVVLILVAADVYHVVLGGQPGGMANMAHLGGAAFGAWFCVSEHRIDGLLERWSQREHERRLRKEAEMRSRVDALLQKISNEGMPSLTRREREFLKKASREFKSPRQG